jgi:hypothetical protein
MLRTRIIPPTALLLAPLAIRHIRLQIIVIVPVKRELIRRRSFARQISVALLCRFCEGQLVRSVLWHDGAGFDVFRAAEDGARGGVEMEGEEGGVG